MIAVGDTAAALSPGVFQLIARGFRPDL